MKRNTLKILIVLLIGGNCFCSQNASADTSLVGVAISKDDLIYIGAVADDETKDSFRKTCKFFNKELSISSFKKLIELPLLNSMKLGYFACDAAWERNADLLKKIMRHMKNIHQHYTPLYNFASSFACLFELASIVKIRMPNKYGAIAQLAQEYSNYSYFGSSITLYDKVKYACYSVASYGEGARELSGFLGRYAEQYDKDSHLESLLNFLCIAIHKDSAICANVLLPYIQNIIPTKASHEKIETYRVFLRRAMKLQKDKVFEALVANNIFCQINGSYRYCNSTLYSMLDNVIEWIQSDQISYGGKYIDICRKHGWKKACELDFESSSDEDESCSIL